MIELNPTILLEPSNAKATLVFVALFASLRAALLLRRARNQLYAPDTYLLSGKASSDGLKRRRSLFAVALSKTNRGISWTSAASACLLAAVHIPFDWPWYWTTSLVILLAALPLAVLAFKRRLASVDQAVDAYDELTRNARSARLPNPTDLTFSGPPLNWDDNPVRKPKLRQRFESRLKTNRWAAIVAIIVPAIVASQPLWASSVRSDVAILSVTVVAMAPVLMRLRGHNPWLRTSVAAAAAVASGELLFRVGREVRIAEWTEQASQLALSIQQQSPVGFFVMTWALACGGGLAAASGTFGDAGSPTRNASLPRESIWHSLPLQAIASVATGLLLCLLIADRTPPEAFVPTRLARLLDLLGERGFEQALLSGLPVMLLLTASVARGAINASLCVVIGSAGIYGATTAGDVLAGATGWYPLADCIDELTRDDLTTLWFVALPLAAPLGYFLSDRVEALPALAFGWCFGLLGAVYLDGMRAESHLETILAFGMTPQFAGLVFCGSLGFLSVINQLRGGLVASVSYLLLGCGGAMIGSTVGPHLERFGNPFESGYAVGIVHCALGIFAFAGLVIGWRSRRSTRWPRPLTLTRFVLRTSIVLTAAASVVVVILRYADKAMPFAGNGGA